MWQSTKFSLENVQAVPSLVCGRSLSLAHVISCWGPGAPWLRVPCLPWLCAQVALWACSVACLHGSVCRLHVPIALACSRLPYLSIVPCLVHCRIHSFGFAFSLPPPFELRLFIAFCTCNGGFAAMCSACRSPCYAPLDILAGTVPHPTRAVASVCRYLVPGWNFIEEKMLC